MARLVKTSTLSFSTLRFFSKLSIVLVKFNVSSPTLIRTTQTQCQNQKRYPPSQRPTTVQGRRSMNWRLLDNSLQRKRYLPISKYLHRPRSGKQSVAPSAPEIPNAFEYSNGKKWLFTVIVALAGTTSSTGPSTLYREYQSSLDSHGWSRCMST
jgi:hypothetical protein